MLRILLAVLCAFSGFPPAVASASLIGSQHEDCCCCPIGHAADHAAASLAETPCGCGCITPARSPDEAPETPRDRSGSDTVSAPAAQVAAQAPPIQPRRVAAKLQLSPVPLRGPPDPAVLCVWQE